MLLAIDPSMCAAGAALFTLDSSYSLVYAVRVTQRDDGSDVVERCRTIAAKLVDAVREGYAMHSGLHITRIATERPQIYQRTGGKSKADPNDQLYMCMMLGSVATLLRGALVCSYKPSDWKGQTPKPVVCARARGFLSPSEQAIFDAAQPPGVSYYDAGEAIAVGLHHTGRYKNARPYKGCT